MGNRQEKIKSIFCLFKNIEHEGKFVNEKQREKKSEKKWQKNEVKFSSNQKKMCFNLNPVGLNIYEMGILCWSLWVCQCFHIHR